MSLNPACRCVMVALPLRDKDQARLLRDEASRLRQQIRAAKEQLRAVDVELAALLEVNKRAKRRDSLSAPPKSSVGGPGEG